MRCQQFFANTLLTLYGAYSGILTSFTCFLFDINYHSLSEILFPPDNELAKNVKKTSRPIKKSANPQDTPPARHAINLFCPRKQLDFPTETSDFGRGFHLFSMGK